MRVALTKELVSNLRRARELAEYSQYALADTLDWKRSKIKRLELGEVQTIIKADYDTWMRVCKKKAGISRWVGFNIRPKRTRPGVVTVNRGARKYFDNAVRAHERETENLVFYTAQMKRDVQDPWTVVGVTVLVEDPVMNVQGSVIGLEFAQDQLPLTKGAPVVFVVHKS